MKYIKNVVAGALIALLSPFIVVGFVGYFIYSMFLFGYFIADYLMND